MEDLSALARRGQLSPSEARRFELSLRASKGLQVLHDVGLAFDVQDAGLPTDDTVVERLALSAAQRVNEHSLPTPESHGEPTVRPARHHPSRAGRRRVMVTVVLLGAFAAGSAAAYWRVQTSGAPAWFPEHWHSSPEPRPPAASANLKPVVKRVLDSVRPQTAVVAASPSADGQAEINELPAVANEPPSRDRKPVPVSVGTVLPGSAELFSEANRQRRAGNLKAAESAYLELQRRYPRADEAALSRIQLGRLLLSRGKAASALAQFDAYLTQASSAALAQEALDGKARALRRLGRSAAEQATWKLLLQRYPESIYAEAARERLSELE